MAELYYNAKVYVEKGHYEQAVLVGDGIIRRIGSSDALLSEAPADATRVDCGGRTLIPGLNDSHMHFAQFSETLNQARIADVKSIGELIEVCISMRTMIGRNEASRTLAALRDLHLPERLIMIVAVIFRFFPVLSGDMKLLRQSIRTRGVFTSPLQKLRALPSYIEILTVPMALRVIRIAETLSASAETRGIDLTRRKSNYLSLRFSAWDVVFCVLLAASIAAGLIL